MDALSIIFLCHNNTTIDMCIESVLEQIKENDEIIVVDDHSDVETWGLLQQYKQANKISLYASSIKGNRSYNRNLGAKAAKNEILVFLDGDMVLGNNGLEVIRQAYHKRPEEAFIGQKHAVNFNPLQLYLYAHIDNYMEQLKTYSGREQLAENLLFQDKRQFAFENERNEKYNWTLYYTGLNTVSKKVFDEIGGFDEAFEAWGSEDVDFGYRISKKYSIGFLNKLHAFHIPHDRDVIKNEISNVKNIKYMLRKYNTWEFEIMDNFFGYGSLPVFHNVIQRMRLLSVSDSDISLNNNEIFIDIISAKHPNGQIFCWENNEKKMICSMLGVSIPCEDKSFRAAYVSEHVFIYPILLTCRILQEALRIAENVYIYPTNDAIRLSWREENILEPKAQRQHYKYEANDIFAFDFKPHRELIKVTYVCGLPFFKNNE